MSEQQPDPITPCEIEHKVDEIWHDGRLEQHYNFLDYHFERDGHILALGLTLTISEWFAKT